MPLERSRSQDPWLLQWQGIDKNALKAYQPRAAFMGTKLYVYNGFVSRPSGGSLNHPFRSHGEQYGEERSVYVIDIANENQAGATASWLTDIDMSYHLPNTGTPPGAGQYHNIALIVKKNDKNEDSVYVLGSKWSTMDLVNLQTRTKTLPVQCPSVSCEHVGENQFCGVDNDPLDRTTRKTWCKDGKQCTYAETNSGTPTGYKSANSMWTCQDTQPIGEQK